MILAPGIHGGLRRDEYAEIAAINQSVLVQCRRSMAHARELHLRPRDPTDAMEIGDATHRAILEPHRLDELVQLAPTAERRSNADKAKWAALSAQHPEAIILKAPEYDRIHRLSEAVWTHPVASELLRGAKTELSAVWQDPATDLYCKGRIDGLNVYDSWPTIVELKTTKDARPWSFARSCLEYGYHVQAAFYLDGLDTIAPLQRRHLIIALEKEPPFALSIFELSEASVDLGRQTYRAALEAWSQCLETGTWPAYPLPVRQLILPEYAFKEGDEAA